MSEGKELEKLVRVPPIDISHLSGPEVERALSALGASLSAGSLKLALDQADKIVKMPLEELNRIRDLATSTVAHCGGYGCG